MDIVEFVEKICGIKLREYQRQYLANMGKIWDQGYTLVWLNGRAVAVPRKEVTDGRSETFEVCSRS